jgi:N-methylhydantoinase B
MTTIDPITTEIIRNAFISAAEEMNATLIRSAYTSVIYEYRDCSVGIFDARHRVLGHSSGLPLFLGNLEACTLYTEKTLGRNVWEPGDVWILNDSYIAGTHLGDVTVYAPIFYEGELSGFSASRAHWADIGAKDPGNPVDSSEIYEEGLRLGPVRVMIGGEMNRDVADILMRNGRFPVSAMGDLQAQISVCWTGQKRMEALLGRYGRETIEAARAAIYAQTEALDRSAVAAIPDGVYEAEGCLDNDGLSDEPAWIRVRVEVAGDEMVIDVTDSNDATRGPINCGEAQTVSACRVGFKSLINPDQPVNGGTFAPLKVRVRQGSMLAAEEPRSCGWYFSGLGLLIDLVVKAMSPVLPDRAAAAHFGDSMVVFMTGTDDRTGKRFLGIGPHVGGWGAWDGGDGESGMINSINGSAKDLPIEIAENKLPIRVTRYGFRPDSGGAGRWRGGCGIVKEYVVECEEAKASFWFERSRTPAWGLFGGEPGAPPLVTINPGRPDERRLLKAARVTVKRGDVIRCETGGGGGFGDPALRDPDLVRADRRTGLVTAEAPTRRA